MSFSDNEIMSKDGTWKIIVEEGSGGAHIRCTGNVPKDVRSAVEKREHDGKCNNSRELRFFAWLLVTNEQEFV